MLIEVDSKRYRKLFPSDPHPFISESFIELNKHKVDRIVHLIDSTDRPEIGLIGGVRDGILNSPFSAPFGGFHFRKEIMYINEIDHFLLSLKALVSSSGFRGIELILPPDIYHPSFNAKTISSLLRNDFNLLSLDITNWVDLEKFSGSFRQKNSREYYRQAIRNGLSFDLVSGTDKKEEVYTLISENRAKYGRSIFMSFSDIQATGNLWSVDFFKVCDPNGIMVASAVFYQNHPEICYGVFWGDNETGRPLRAMDFLSFNLWTYYKDLGYKYIDLGISTERGIPNEGLLRFKESHDSVSSLRYKFSYYQ
jgi:hypothetical protein